MEFLLFVCAVLIFLVIFGIILAWKIYISKSEEPVKDNTPLSIFSKSDVRAWFVEWLANPNWRGEEVITNDTVLTEFEVKSALFVAKDKFGLNLETQQDDVWILEFKGNRTFFCFGKELAPNTVYGFVDMLYEQIDWRQHIEWRQNKQKSQAG